MEIKNNQPRQQPLAKSNSHQPQETTPYLNKEAIEGLLRANMQDYVESGGENF